MVNREAGKEATDVEHQMALEGRPDDPGKISFGSHSGLLDVHSMDPKGHSGEIMMSMLHLPLAGAERDSYQALGKMGKDRHPKGPGRVGAKKHLSFLIGTCGKMWLEAHLHIQPMDKGHPTEIHLTIHTD